jgi:hypothetical protein
LISAASAAITLTLSTLYRNCSLEWAIFSEL